MPNALLTPKEITRRALAIFKNENAIIGAVNRQYDDRFAQSGAKIGDTLQIRLPNRYNVIDGPVWTAQDITERKVDLVVARHKMVPLEFGQKELALDVDDFQERFIAPAAAALASTVALDISIEQSRFFHQAVGTPGTVPGAFATYADGAALINWQTAPKGNRHAVVNPTVMAALADANKGLFAPAQSISGQYTDGVVERMTGLAFHSEQSLPTVINGSGTGYLTNTPTQPALGANTLAVDTGTGTLVPGQVFTIANVFEINPDTKQSTGNLKQFVVAANYGGGFGNLTIGQQIFVSGPYRNVSGNIPDNAALTFVGAPGLAIPRGMIFHRDSTILATADFELPRGVDMAERAKDDGISMTLIRAYDPVQGRMVTRLEVLYGILVCRPEWGAQVLQ